MVCLRKNCFVQCPFQLRSKQRNKFIRDNDIALNNIDIIYQGNVEILRTEFHANYYGMLNSYTCNPLYSLMSILSRSFQGQTKKANTKQWNSRTRKEARNSLQGKESQKKKKNNAVA